MTNNIAGRLRMLRYPMFVSAAIVAILFLFFPAIDTAVSHLAYSQGRFMQADEHWWIGLLYYGIPKFAWLVLALLIGLLLMSYTGQPAWRKPAIFLLCAFLLGPGLFVHGILKDHWGRARPFQTTEFGGQKVFSPAWVKTDQCEKNCSFVSGHAAMGFYPLAVAFLGWPYRRWLWGGVALGCFTGIVRIAQGGHFLSDIVFAFYVVYFAAWLSYWLVYRRSPRLWGCES